MSNSVIQNDEARPDVDAVLGEFFKAQMPTPWPAFKAPLQTRLKRPESYWSRYSGRLALAACVALLVAGYITLAGFFPRGQGPSGVQNQIENHIGQRDKSPEQPKPAPNPDAVPMPTEFDR